MSTCKSCKHLGHGVCPAPNAPKNMNITPETLACPSYKHIERTEEEVKAAFELERGRKDADAEEQAEPANGPSPLQEPLKEAAKLLQLKKASVAAALLDTGAAMAESTEPMPSAEAATEVEDSEPDEDRRYDVQRGV